MKIRFGHFVTFVNFISFWCNPFLIIMIISRSFPILVFLLKNGQHKAVFRLVYHMLNFGQKNLIEKKALLHKSLHISKLWKYLFYIDKSIISHQIFWKNIITYKKYWSNTQIWPICTDGIINSLSLYTSLNNHF